MTVIKVTKEECRDFALHLKEITGQFPLQKEWVFSKGFPCGVMTLTKLFKSYNLFREFCNEPIIKRNDQPVTIDWLRSQCTIDEKGCWLWNNCTDRGGYGTTYHEGKQQYTHRVSFKLSHTSENIDELQVRHKCHVKLCCNPAHLESGTRGQNTIDSREYSKAYKLTKEDVIKIRLDMKNYDFSIKGTITKFDTTWSTHYNVGLQTISNLRRNLSHKDINV